MLDAYSVLSIRALSHVNLIVFDASSLVFQIVREPELYADALTLGTFCAS